MDRAMNPHDGSRRRLKSSAHKSLKDYDRKKNKQITKNDCMEYKKGDLIYSLHNKTVERICKLGDRFTDSFGVDSFYVLNVIGRDEPMQGWIPISESVAYQSKPTVLSIPVDYIARLVTPAEFDLYMDLIGSWQENLLEPEVFKGTPLKLFLQEADITRRLYNYLPKINDNEDDVVINYVEEISKERFLKVESLGKLSWRDFLDAIMWWNTMYRPKGWPPIDATNIMDEEE